MYENQIPPIDYVLITILSSVLAYSTYNQESDVNEEEKEPSLLSNLTGSADEKPKEEPSFLSNLTGSTDEKPKEEPSILSNLTGSADNKPKEEPSFLSNLTGSTDEKPIESSIEKTDNKIFGGKTHRRKKQTKKNVHKLK